MREVIPFRERKFDWLFVTFFVLNFFIITYLIDIEQVIITDTSNFEYPVWPPKAVVDLAHWFGNTYDPLLMARPVWWRMTIWIDQLFFGPFYAFAVYAFVRGRDWIRIPSVIWASVMMTNVTIILGEEMFGEHATHNRSMVLFANASWLIFPILLLIRMWHAEHPFTREVK